VDIHLIPIVHDSSGQLDGLIVEPTGQRTGQYHRVGRFRTSFLRKNDTLKFDEALRVAQIEDSEYIEMLVDAEGSRHYVIYIV
jgi:hypothetical protein